MHQVTGSSQPKGSKVPLYAGALLLHAGIVASVIYLYQRATANDPTSSPFPVGYAFLLYAAINAGQFLTSWSAGQPAAVTRRFALGAIGSGCAGAALFLPNQTSAVAVMAVGVVALLSSAVLTALKPTTSP